jgi:DNA repair photolyase
VIIKFTITTVDDQLSQIIEPHAPVSSLRFQALKKLSDACIYTGILIHPILPFITDTEENIKAMVK